MEYIISQEIDLKIQKKIHEKITFLYRNSIIIRQQLQKGFFHEFFFEFLNQFLAILYTPSKF